MECVTKPLLWLEVTELIDGYFMAALWVIASRIGLVSRGFEFITQFPVSKLDDENLCECMELPILKERIFHFSKETVCKLKAKANYEMGTKSISSLSFLGSSIEVPFTYIYVISHNSKFNMHIVSIFIHVAFLF